MEQYAAKKLMYRLEIRNFEGSLEEYSQFITRIMADINFKVGHVLGAGAKCVVSGYQDAIENAESPEGITWKA